MRLIFFSFFLAVNIISGQEIIWQEGQKLTWDNFKSPVNRRNNPDIAAYTHCGWEYSIVKSTNPDSPVQIEIRTIFNEDKSWKDFRKINDYILLHEQKHFDIAELFVRKMRKIVAEKIKKSSDYNRLFTVIYKKISDEYKNFQTAYDRDTRHGMNKEKQAEYNVFIAEELDHLKSYKSL